MTSLNDILKDPRIDRREAGPVNLIIFDLGKGQDPIVASYERQPFEPGRDAYRYTLPNVEGKGGTFSHPTQHGCEIMIARFLVDLGLLGPDPENRHLSAVNMEIAGRTITTFQERQSATDRPLVGEVILSPDGDPWRAAHAWGDGMQTCKGGSFYAYSDGFASMSGSLDQSQPWARFLKTDQILPARFWFFDEGQAGAGRGVDFYMPCRVFQLIGGVA